LPKNSTTDIVAAMAKKHESTDEMIDAHVWIIRHIEARLMRLLTLDSISDELLAQFGLSRRRVKADSYRCTDPTAVLVPLSEISVPDRKLNEDALRSLLSGVRDSTDLPPVVIFREPGAATARLLDGIHRYRLSAALGFRLIPAIQPTRDDAELCYRYLANNPN
jgi:hypothetical protein